MAAYLALVHSDDGRSFGVSFPDVPGCVAVGRSLEDALKQGADALSAHLSWMASEGDPIPRPRSFEALAADPEVQEDAEGATWAVVETRAVAAPRIRLNIMMDTSLLREADEAAGAEGLTRSGFIEEAVRGRLARMSAARRAQTRSHSGCKAGKRNG
jgi:predicted RNase H-like HicB family nuclease